MLSRRLKNISKPPCPVLLSLGDLSFRGFAGIMIPYQRIGNFTAQVLYLPPFAFRLVLDTLDPLPEDRKCFRMINGVLVERTVKDVVPALKTNSDGLKKVLEELVKQYKKQQDDMEKWKVSTTVVCTNAISPMHDYKPQLTQQSNRRRTISRSFNNDMRVDKAQECCCFT